MSDREIPLFKGRYEKENHLADSPVDIYRAKDFKKNRVPCTLYITNLNKNDRKDLERSVQSEISARRNIPGGLTLEIIEEQSIENEYFVVEEFAGESLDTLLNAGRKLSSEQASRLVASLIDLLTKCDTTQIEYLLPSSLILNKKGDCIRIATLGKSPVFSYADFKRAECYFPAAYWKEDLAETQKNEADLIYMLGMIVAEALIGRDKFENILSRGAGLENKEAFLNWHLDLSVELAPLTEIDDSIFDDLSSTVGLMVRKEYDFRYRDFDELGLAFGVGPQGSTDDSQPDNVGKPNWPLYIGIPCIVLVLAVIVLISWPGANKGDVDKKINRLKSSASMANSIRANHFDSSVFSKAQSFAKSSETAYKAKDYRLALDDIESAISLYRKSIGNTASKYAEYLTWKIALAFDEVAVHAENDDKSQYISAVDLALENKKAGTLPKINDELNALLGSAPRVFTVGSADSEIEQAFLVCKEELKNCDQSWYASEKQREILLAPFKMDIFPATVAAFKAFVEDTGFQTSAEISGAASVYDGLNIKRVKGMTWRDSHRRSSKPVDNLPVVYASRNDAEQYCTHLGKRLPLEGEWEYYVADSMYPWGSNEESNYTAVLSKSTDDNVVEMSRFFWKSPVSFSNVWEWTSSNHEERYAVLKGGSWLEKTWASKRSRARRFESPDVASNDSGIRCAQDLERWPNVEEEALWSIFQQQR